jgi:hypothetical protein
MFTTQVLSCGTCVFYLRKKNRTGLGSVENEKTAFNSGV